MNTIKYVTGNRMKFLPGTGMTLLLLSMLALSSCKKYLDIKRAGFDKFIETQNDCQALLDDSGVMNSNYPSDGEASAGDAYLGTNAYPSNISQEDKNIYTWQPTAVRTNSNPQWLAPYQVIYSANLVIAAIEKGLIGTTADGLNNIKGSALFYRAYALWNVAQLYAKPYGSSASTDPGVPVRTSSDLNDAVGRGTVKDTYDRITKDLQDALSLLPTTGAAATRPDKASAYAMLARVYLSMEDYPQALSNANASLSLKPVLIDYNNNISTTSLTPFTRYNSEVLFHSIISRNDKLLGGGDVSNPNARIQESLYNMYDVNDLRKVIFFKQGTGIYAGTYIFTGNYEPDFNPVFFNGLTTAEMYLTRAECYARAGNLNLAMADLKTLLVKRYKPNTYVDPVVNNATQVLGIVLNERRKELVMRSQRWTDLRRLNKDSQFKTDLSRTVSEGGATTTYTLQPSDLRYTLLIPIEVINNAKMEQNPR